MCIQYKGGRYAGGPDCEVERDEEGHGSDTDDREPSLNAPPFDENGSGTFMMILRMAKKVFGIKGLVKKSARLSEVLFT